MRICLLALVSLVTAAIHSTAADVRPSISTQPLSQAVNPGSSVTLGITASGTVPLRFQWRFNDADLDGSTNTMLALTNLQPSQQGDYSVVVTNNAGAITSRVAQLRIVSGFTRVTNSSLARGGTRPVGAAWGDFNNDGWVDLVAASAERYLIYTNRGDGTFQTVTNLILGGEVNGGRTGMAWADFDNDGNLDLAIGGDFTIANTSLYLYRGRGQGQFDRVATNIFLTSGLIQYGTAWGDYDNDGFVDLLIPTASSGGAGGMNDIVFHNNGNGTFARVTNILIAQDNDADQGLMWADFDNDGDLDLFATGRNRNHLYRNEGGGNFIQLSNSPVSLDGNISGGCAWGDFDNDGDLDLFVTNFGRDAWLYRNEGGGAFTRVTNSIVAVDGQSAGCIWLDFDNDGWLDLVSPGPKNLLYHNNGDGTFLKVTTGPVVGQAITSWGNNSFASADANRDGFLDLLWVDWDGNSQFFMNDGNSNAWLSVRCDGRLSNRAGIGAKVRVKAIIGGREIWQLREIGGGGLVFTQNEPIAHFGLGDATNAELVRIEWPSGLVQELHGVAARQFLTVVEPDAHIAPAALEVQAGEPVTFTVVSTLAPLLEFQWKLNGVALPGETNLSLIIAHAQTQNAGAYSVTVTQPTTGLSFDTRPALLTGPVAITQQPTNLNVRLGSNALFRVTARGSTPIVYQWLKDGLPLAGATNPVLSLTNVQLGDEGNYTAIISNSFGAQPSQPARLVILIRPTITMPPVSQSVVVGGSVTLSGAAQGHPLPLTYRWLKSGATFTNMDVHDTAAFLTLTNLQPTPLTNRFYFRLIVTNLAGSSVTSPNAIITVLADTDGDGMPDEWELAHGLSETNSVDATEDRDGDSVSNVQEYQSGTDPNDPQSYLRVETLSQTNSSAWMLRFFAVSNRTYTVEACPQLGGGPWLREADVPAAPTNRLIEIIRASDGVPRRFFRLVTPRAD